MIINWYGGSCFKIATPDFAVITDADSSASGGRLKGDLFVKTESDLEEAINNKEAHVILGPGEYEFQGVKVRGQKEAEEKNKIITAYKIIFEDIKFGLIPMSSEMLSEEAADILSDVDILVVPGNEFGAKFTKRIGPKIVIPADGNQKKFATDFGQAVEPEEKLVIKKKDLEGMENTKVVILNK